MKRVERRNIDSRMHDIRPPADHWAAAFALFRYRRMPKRTVPVRDISPPAREYRVVTQSVAKARNGVPLTQFVAQQKGGATVASDVLDSRNLEDLGNQDVNQDTTVVIPKWRSLAWSSFAVFLGLVVVGIVVAGSLFWAGKGVVVRLTILQQNGDAVALLDEGQQALRAGRYDRAAETFHRARGELASTERVVGVVGRAFVGMVSLLPGGGFDRLEAAYTLLRLARDLAEVGEYASTVLATFATGADTTPTDRVAETLDEVRTIVERLADIRSALAHPSLSSVGPPLASSIRVLRESIGPLETVMEQFVGEPQHLLAILGHDRPKTYLVLLQNSAELRPTGGFIGTVVRLEIDRGVITTIEATNTFDIDGQLSDRIIPPRPLQKITTAWSLHDSNWFFDFPMSARTAAWFYEHAGNPSVDGVIAVTPAVVQQLLVLMGPVDLPGYGITFTADNILLRLQQQVEVGYTQSLNKPKRIVGDLVPVLLERIEESDPEQRARIAALLLKHLEENDILLYDRTAERQQWLEQRGWAGQVRETDSDYLAVVHTNINGFKTDAVIEDIVNHVVDVRPDGRIVDTVTVRRRHTGGETGFSWWDSVNADYLRVYVPRGSRLLTADGHTPERLERAINYAEHQFRTNSDVVAVENTMQIDADTGTHVFEEAGKTVFGNWVYVSPGEEVVVRYTYELPFRFTGGRLSVLFQHQPGNDGVDFSGILRGFDAVAWVSDTLTDTGDGWAVERTLEDDLLYGIVAE